MSMPVSDVDGRTMQNCQLAAVPELPVILAKARREHGRYAEADRAEESDVNAALTWIACAGWLALIGVVFLLVAFV